MPFLKIQQRTKEPFQQYISVILWQSVLLVEEIGVPGENHRPAASHWQTWSQELKVVLRISLDKGKSMNKVLFYFILLTTSYSYKFM
jgi:hypothetical protein